MGAATFPLGLAVLDPPQGILPSDSNVPNPNSDDSNLLPQLDTFTRAVHQDVEEVSVPVSNAVHHVEKVNAPVSHHSAGGAHQDAGGCQSIAVNINASSDSTDSVVKVPQQPVNEIVSLVHHYNAEIPLSVQELNPEAATFQACDSNLVHRGRICPDLDSDWAHIQQVSAGGVGDLGFTDQGLWQGQVTGTRARTLQASQREPILPFTLVEDLSDILGTAPKQVHKVNSLLDMTVRMPCGSFIDKVLPQPSHTLKIDEVFTADYYVALHNVTAAPGIRADGSVYPAYTPNHLGARVRMPHVKLRLDRWRYHLLGYEDAELVQFLEFGFPLGLSSLPDLECSTRNHGSAYMWYDHVDKFVCNEIQEGGMAGPFQKAPWWNAVISPLMTAHKKVLSRRTVFDATFGERSLNIEQQPTTCMTYLGVQFDSVMMMMSVPPEKVTEIKAEIGLWVRKTTITRRDLQSLLGKLFWIGKVVMHSRPFMGRLLAQLRTMSNLKDSKKVRLNEESRKDILWWQRYLDTFNGISMIVNEEPIPLSMEQLLDDPHQVCAGDATPSGAGAWHGKEYWCQELPAYLRDPSIPIHIKEFWTIRTELLFYSVTMTASAIPLSTKSPRIHPSCPFYVSFYT